MSEFEKRKDAKQGLPKRRHSRSLGSPGQEDLSISRRSSSTEVPSWCQLLFQLSKKPTSVISIALFNKTVSEAIDLLQRNDGNKSLERQTKELILEELRDSIRESELNEKLRKLKNVLEIPQTRLLNQLNDTQEMSILTSKQTEEEQRSNLNPSETLRISQSTTRGNFNTVPQIMRAMSSMSSMTRDNPAAGYTEPFNLNKTLLELEKQPIQHQVQRTIGATSFNGLDSQINSQRPSIRRESERSPFEHVYGSLSSSDNALNREMELNLCKRAPPFVDPSRNYIPRLESRYSVNWDKHQTTTLAIPENSQEFTQILTPPRISQEVVPKMRLGSAASNNAERRRSSVPLPRVPEVEDSAEWRKPDDTTTPFMSLVVLTNAVLLTSGNRQCLVVPTERQQSETAVNLTEEDMRLLIDKQAVVPLTQSSSNDLSRPSRSGKTLDTRADGSETVFQVENDETSPALPCFEASDGTSLASDSTPMKRLSEILGKPILNLGQSLVMTSSAIGSSSQVNDASRGGIQNHQQITSRHNEERFVTRNDKRRRIKFLVRSTGSDTNAKCDLFSVSGFVQYELWCRMLSVIDITSYEDIPNVLNWFRHHEVQDLTLDKTETRDSGEAAIASLYRNNLALMAHLPDFLVAFLPTPIESEHFDLTVYVKFHEF